MKQMINAGATMTEPVTTAGGLAAFGLKFGAILGAGTLGALAIAAFDPPKDKKIFRAQAAVAGVFAIIFTKLAIKALASLWPSVFDISNANIWDALDVVLPVAFVTGAMSWGFMGALVKLRDIVKSRGADALAEKVGMGVKTE